MGKTLMKLGTGIIICLLIVWSAGAEEVKFRSKTYTPSREFGQKSFEGKSYTPRAAPPAKTYDAAVQRDWKPLSDGNRADAQPFVPRAGETPAAKFTPRAGETRVITFTTPAEEEREHKPYVAGAPLREDKPHVNREPDGGYNPFLRPRQGIKEEHLNEPTPETPQQPSGRP